ncbi:hypothetical protein [Lactiplantibacillus carotarum]|nr:hypothetical protein [Lactiplantibacillus carotarum]
MRRKLSWLMVVVTGTWSIVRVLLRWWLDRQRGPRKLKIKIKMK